jgi:uncharacterized membrane protein
VSEAWESTLERWRSAGLIESATAGRIRDFEAGREQPAHLRWPILIAIGFGALMLAAGVLLFVSAHWDEMSPASRFSLVLFLVAVFPCSFYRDAWSRHRSFGCWNFSFRANF